MRRRGATAKSGRCKSNAVNGDVCPCCIIFLAPQRARRRRQSAPRGQRAKAPSAVTAPCGGALFRVHRPPQMVCAGASVSRGFGARQRDPGHAMSSPPPWLLAAADLGAVIRGPSGEKRSRRSQHPLCSGGALASKELCIEPSMPVAVPSGKPLSSRVVIPDGNSPRWAMARSTYVTCLGTALALCDASDLSPPGAPPWTAFGDRSEAGSCVRRQRSAWPRAGERSGALTMRSAMRIVPAIEPTRRSPCQADRRLP